EISHCRKIVRLGCCVRSGIGAEIRHSPLVPNHRPPTVVLATHALVWTCRLLLSPAVVGALQHGYEPEIGPPIIEPIAVNMFYHLARNSPHDVSVHEHCSAFDARCRITFTRRAVTP